MPASAARYLLPLAALAWALLLARPVNGQGTAPGGADRAQATNVVDRPISEIQIIGLSRVSEQLVRNQLRSVVGDPYDPRTVNADVRTLYRLGEFSEIIAEFELNDGGAVILRFRVREAPVIVEVQVVGNKVISDQDMLAVARVFPGSRRDDYLIENAKREMEALYQKRGYYQVNVTVDESELEETGILFFRVFEGPRVRVKAIVFVGNAAFTDSQIQAEISTKTAVPLLRRGQLDNDQLIEDIAAVIRFYEARGYIDVRVDRTIDLSLDRKEVKVTFEIVEGRQYTLRSITTNVILDGRDQPDRPLGVFSPEQVAARMTIKPGDVYSRDKLRASERELRTAYLVMGYLDLRDPNALRLTEIRSGTGPEVDIKVTIQEGRAYKVGEVEIIGNFLTRDSVIRRHLRGLRPGRPFDGRQIDRATQLLRATRLFNDVQITVAEPKSDDSPYRDVIVEVKESNTGSVNFGIAAGSDSGVFGEFSIVQRNFDITDTPASFRELVTGRAFRGGGQRFSMTLRPGNEFFQYAISWTEPAFFDSNNSLSVSALYTEREFRTAGRRIYDETRLSLPLRMGRRLGTIWDVGLSARVERIELSNFDATAPVDYFQDAGPNTLTSLGFDLTRSTVTSFQRPGSGTRLQMAFDQAGALGGDLTFSKVTLNYTSFLTTHRDFLGRRSILKLSGRVGYIFAGDAPTYERFYLGGRTLRGLDFRTVSPKGLDQMGNQTTDPVGGEWLLFAGAQYEIPLLEESLNVVVFADTGTVTNDPGFDEYRISVGAGLRIYIPQFGPVPLAFDFGFPIVKEESDEEQVFSFSAELPF